MTRFNATDTAVRPEAALADVPSTTGLPRLLSTEQVATWVCRSERTIRGWARDGLLRKVRIGRGVFYPESDVMTALNAAKNTRYLE